MQIPPFRCERPPWWQMCEDKVCLCVKWSHAKGQGVPYCKHCGFAEGLNQSEPGPWAAAAFSLFVLLISHKVWDCWEILKLMFWLDFKYPSPQALSLLKIPSYQTATSSQIIGFSCCSSAAFSSARMCSDRFLAIFLIVNKAHSGTVYITTIQIIPS